MLISCQHIAREIVNSYKSPSKLIFSKDSLSVDYINTAYFATKEAEELYNEGIVASINNDFPKADKKLKAALKIEPENFNTLEALGNAYANGNRLDEAVKYFNRAIAVSDSIYPGVFLNLSKVYAAQDEFQKALAALEYVINIEGKDDYILQVFTYYQFTVVKMALLDCAGAERSFNIYEELIKKDNRFNALKNNVLKYLVRCTGTELRENYQDPETGELLASAETLFLELELEEKQWATLITLFPSQISRDEMVITKKIFHDYLYTDFYNNSKIAASGITGKRGNTLYAVTDLVSVKGQNKARIFYKLEIEEEYSNMEILEVTYSHPEENVTIPNQISSL